MNHDLRRNVIVGLLGLLAVCQGCGLSNDVARLRGYEALGEGNHAQAREYFESCVQRDPTDWKSHYYLGRIGLDAMNDPYYARRHFELAATIRQSIPDNALAPRPGASETAVPFPTRHQIADGVAESMLRQGLTARLYHYVRQQATEYGETDDYLRVGRYLESIDDRDAAEVAYTQATMIAAIDDPRPHLEFAGFYDRAGDRDAALTELRKAYYIDPTIKDLADNIRRHGMVPGPTIAIPPQRDKPPIVQRGKPKAEQATYPPGSSPEPEAGSR